MKINGKTPKEINEGLAIINKYLSIMQSASRQANIEAEKLFGKKKPDLKLIK